MILVTSFKAVRMVGTAPTFSDWKSDVLLLYDTRIQITQFAQNKGLFFLVFAEVILAGRERIERSSIDLESIIIPLYQRPVEGIPFPILYTP